MIKVNGTNYLFYSSWGRGYEVDIATLKSIGGPWIKQEDNPIYGAQSRYYCALLKRNIPRMTLCPLVMWVTDNLLQYRMGNGDYVLMVLEMICHYH